MSDQPVWERDRASRFRSGGSYGRFPRAPRPAPPGRGPQVQRAISHGRSLRTRVLLGSAPVLIRVVVR